MALIDEKNKENIDIAYKNSTKYKGYALSKVYEIIDLETGDCVVHGYSIEDCKRRVDEIIEDSGGLKS